MRPPLTLSLLGTGLCAPGLPGWAAARPLLAALHPPGPGTAARLAALAATPFTPPAATMLAANERRRASPTIRLALAAAGEAATAAGLSPAALPTVFGSRNGEGEALGALLTALAAAEPVSPTRFHNSVHNAAAAHWAMATGATTPSTALGAHDASFAAALLAAAATAIAEATPVLMCCYDFPLPPPLDAACPTEAAFAVAFVLAPSGPGPQLGLTWQPASPAAPEPAPSRRNPAAAALPLLAALAAGAPAEFALPCAGGHLALALAGRAGPSPPGAGAC